MTWEKMHAAACEYADNILFPKRDTPPIIINSPRYHEWLFQYDLSMHEQNQELKT